MKNVEFNTVMCSLKNTTKNNKNKCNRDKIIRVRERESHEVDVRQLISRESARLQMW